VRFRGFETVTPAGWGLPAAVDAAGGEAVRAALGVDWAEIVERVRHVGYDFLPGLYDDQVGALRHYYGAKDGELGPLDSGNFLMALNFVVMYDLFGDREMLVRAERCFTWAMANCCETHPMDFWQGGVRDGNRPWDLWVKYSGDAFWLALALYRRTGAAEYAQAIAMFHNFLKRAREAGFAYVFDTRAYTWRSRGNAWRAFGFPVTAYLEWYEQGHDPRARVEALAWGRAALPLQSPSGLFHLIDGEFWNSDLAAPELRGLVYLWEETGERTFLHSAVRYADAMLALQRADGAWPLGVDRDGEVCVATVGPGDVPNIAMSLVRLHGATGDGRYLDAACRAIRYSLSVQAVVGGKYALHLDDPRVRWGYWSWDPLYDETLSGDQSIHHIRGTLFVAAYLAALAHGGGG
jgi:hypothetical protein